jgi:hypothetical protein
MSKKSEVDSEIYKRLGDLEVAMNAIQVALKDVAELPHDIPTIQRLMIFQKGQSTLLKKLQERVDEMDNLLNKSAVIKYIKDFVCFKKPTVTVGGPIGEYAVDTYAIGSSPAEVLGNVAAWDKLRKQAAWVGVDVNGHDLLFGDLVTFAKHAQKPGTSVVFRIEQLDTIGIGTDLIFLRRPA